MLHRGKRHDDSANEKLKREQVLFPSPADAAEPLRSELWVRTEERLFFLLRSSQLQSVPVQT
jgi:hypothetical protein